MDSRQVAGLCSVCGGSDLSALCTSCVMGGFMLSFDPYKIQALFAFFRDQGFWLDPSLEVDLSMLWWVEGEKENSKGELVWQPLYCARTEDGANRILRMILKDDDKPIPTEKAAARERLMLAEFDDFRVMRGAEENEPGKKVRKSSKVSKQPAGENLKKCPRCGSKDRKKVKKGDLKLWKCQDCSTRWARSSSQTSVEPQEPPKSSSRTDHPKKTKKKRQKGS